MAARKRRTILLRVLGVLGALLVIVALAGALGWRAVTGYFMRQYYRTSYAPAPLASGQIAASPTSYHIAGIPWISVEQSLCQSTSLQMIASRPDAIVPRQQVDFLMGFTYGTTEIPGRLGFIPGTDPEIGYMVAVPYLGLVRHYYTTDDEGLLVRALRSYLSQDHPVRVALDMAVLYGASGQIPHSEVLAGYDEGGFYYYETVCHAPAPCQPGTRPAGDKGLYVANQRLLAAIRAESQSFGYPWRYAFAIFEPGPAERDLKPVWKRNGEALVGNDEYAPLSGATALEALADRIEKAGPDADLASLKSGLETATFAFQENARYLRATFDGIPQVTQAADQLDEASSAFGAALDAMSEEQNSARNARIAGSLRQAAAAQRAAGQAFIALAQ